LAHRLHFVARMHRNALLLLTAASLLGCGRQRPPRMSILSHEQSRDLTPSAGKALMVFLRPGKYGGNVPALLWSDGPEFIGVLHFRTFVAIELEPGAHTFMVQSETGNFLEADLEAGKTYFAVVRARPGWNRARFSLSAPSPGSDDWNRIGEWMDAAREAVTNNLVEEWAAGQRERASLIWQKKYPS
jgi:hypothetical protein